MREGIETMLEARFGEDGVKLMPEIHQIAEEEKLRAILKALPKAVSLEEVRQLWASENP
jgi:hypothetical protein